MTWQSNHNEQQSAKELDQLITALQQGQPTPDGAENGQLAQQLVQLAATIQPHQPFVNNLRAQLAAQAHQKSQSKKGVTLTSILEEWVKQISMKRTLVTLAGVTAIIVFAVIGWNLFRPEVSPEPATDIVAVATTDDTAAQPETAVTADEEVVDPSTTTEIESSPAMEVAVIDQPMDSQAVEAPMADEAVAQGAPFFGRGGGGGGGYGFGEGQSPFVDASLTLNTELPQAVEAAVYEAPVQNSLLTLDEAGFRSFADKMGVTGKIYFEWYNGMPLDGKDDGSGNGAYSYRIFDGKKQVTAYLSGEMFYEDINLYSQNLQPLPYAERAAIAEQFLQERNLLDFDYEVHPGWGNEVQFLTMVDGLPVNNWSLITVNVTGDSQILSVSIRPFGELSQLQAESLRSAADAWQYLQDNLADGPIMFNLIASDPAYYAPPPSSSVKTHWEREFGVGQEVTLNSWIQIFRPADGSITPRLSTDRGMILAADDTTLEAIAEAVSFGNNVRLQGAISGETDNLVLNVSNWEPFVGPFDIYLNGTSRLVNGAVALELPGGFPIQLANPPADLPIDSFISVYSWSVRVADDGVSAIADWVAIDLTDSNYIDPGVPPVEDPFSNISGIAINKVELVYNYLYPFESLNPSTGIPYIANDNSHLVPFWRFTGETNKGDLVEFMIPAPANVELPVAADE